MKNTYSTPALITVCAFWFLLGIATWKWGYVIVGWLR